MAGALAAVVGTVVVDGSLVVDELCCDVDVDVAAIVVAGPVDAGRSEADVAVVDGAGLPAVQSGASPSGVSPVTAAFSAGSPDPQADKSNAAATNTLVHSCARLMEKA